MSQAQLEKKVADYLRDSQVLENYWEKAISPEQLQAEMVRMARDTKQPEVLRESFEALGNDPAVIAECLARPVLTERLIAILSAEDKTRRFASLGSDRLRTMSPVTALGQAAYSLPKIANTDSPLCPNDTWTATRTVQAPDSRRYHTAVWTGSEMIVWGGSQYYMYPNTGGRYNPVTNSWTPTSVTNAPAGRENHTAVWTGSKMIIWGGDYFYNSAYHFLNTGSKYNPVTNSWAATSTTNAPAGRDSHTAVWTGSQMIVWGGESRVVLNTGGRYCVPTP